MTLKAPRLIMTKHMRFAAKVRISTAHTNPNSRVLTQMGCQGTWSNQD